MNTTVDSPIDGLEKTGCRIEVHAIGVPQSSSERKRNEKYFFQIFESMSLHLFEYA